MKQQNKILSFVGIVLLLVMLFLVVNTLPEGGVKEIKVSQILGSSDSEPSVDYSLGASDNFSRKNIIADYFWGDGSHITGISGDNSSWNQSLAETLFAPILYGDDWNKTYADTLYAVTGYGDDWNKTYADTLYDPIGGSDTNETGRFNNLTGNCSAGDFMIGVVDATGERVCDTPAGSGDITGINTTGIYLYGGCESGTCALFVNETELNDSIDLRDSDTTYTAGSNLTLDGTEFSLNVSSLTDWLDTIYTKIVDAFDGTWASLTGKPTHLSNFTDDITYTSGFNSTGDDRWLDNTDNQTLSYSGGNVTITGGNSVNISAVNTDTQLTEDQVEAYIFDNDNTDNLNVSGYNITGVDCFFFESGGSWCSA